ncbi:MAG: cupin domain-containing protein [Candidatus Binatia bacterium]
MSEPVDPSLTDLRDAAWEEVYPGVRRQTVGATRMTMTRYAFAPGGRFPTHRHDQEQLTLVLDGELVFTIDHRAVHLQPEQLLVIPAGVPHEAVGGPAGATVVSVVSPARRDSSDYSVDC